jgi:hypothetical protein
MHVKCSPHVEEAGHEKRASIHRTASGRGEQAYINPAPVILLIHVCKWAHEIPLPQFWPAIGAKIALTPVPRMQSANAKNAKSFILLYYYSFVLFLRLDTNKFDHKININLIKYINSKLIQVNKWLFKT